MSPFGLSARFLPFTVFTVVSVVVRGIIISVFPGADAVQYNAQDVGINCLKLFHAVFDDLAGRYAGSGYHNDTVDELG